MFRRDLELPVQKRFSIAFFYLAIAGVGLLICKEFLLPQFILVVDILTSAESLPIVVYCLGWAATVFVGIFGLCTVVLFKVATDELATLART